MKILIEIKILLTRSLNYISLLNTGMLLYLTLEKKHLGLNIWLTYILLILGALAIGAVEVYVFKGMSRDVQRSYELSPPY
jgi:hypothetical protein